MIISGHSMYRDDPEGNYAKARSKLDQLFRLHRDSFSATVEQITKGKQLAPLDYKGHLALFAELSQAYSMVNSTGNEAEFDRRDVVRKIVNRRLEHYSTKFWVKDEKKIRQTGKGMSFEDLLDELQKWMVVLINRGVNEKQHEEHNSSNNDNGGKQTARVNATTSRGKGGPRQQSQQAQQPETMAQHIENSPPQQQPTTRCNICNSLHDTNECHVLANMTEVDDRVKKIGEKGLCFHCLQPGHTARLCTQKPKCNVCHKRHNTLLHQRRMSYNQVRTIQDNSIPFQQSSQNAPSFGPYPPAQNAADPARINHQMSAPPPHGPPVQPSAPTAATHPII